MIVLPGEHIKAITAEGLTYMNDEGEEAFIDFARCFQQYLDDHTSPQAVENYKKWNPDKTEQDWKESIARLKATKYVANRNFDGDAGLTQPFIEFFTEPPVHFGFPSQNGFYEVLTSLKKAGWRTFDIT